MQYQYLDEFYAYRNYERVSWLPYFQRRVLYLLHQSLDQKVEKTSPTLGRQAVYSQKSRITRLPGYLVVHMVRFAWRQDIAKKAKIMVWLSFAHVVHNALMY